jgi:hypothetical protein
LTPGLDRLEIGRDLMTIFTLVEFRRDEHLTMQIKRGTGAFHIFGDIAGTYLIVPRTAGSCRLVVKLLARYPRGPLGRMMSVFLPWGDLVMMRRQLLNLKSLAEQSPQQSVGLGRPQRPNPVPSPVEGGERSRRMVTDPTDADRRS